KRFPPNGRPEAQSEWILRQHFDADRAAMELARHRSAKDPRWCTRHFTFLDDVLPIDLRPESVPSLVPDRLPVVPLRTTRPADLVPPSKFSQNSIVTNVPFTSSLTSLSHTPTVRTPAPNHHDYELFQFSYSANPLKDYVGRVR
ncbi:hypothetical protein PFISCL1PPCAC_21247, partial [Pristionchus fissidentatus]